MGVRSETLCQALQMYLCACLFCVLWSLYLLLMQGQLSGPAEVLCVQTWTGEATLPCRVTKPRVQLWRSCVAISSLPTMQSEPAGMLCRGRMVFCGWIRAGFYGHFFAPTLLWMRDCCWFPMCTGHSLELCYPHFMEMLFEMWILTRFASALIPEAQKY